MNNHAGTVLKALDGDTQRTRKELQDELVVQAWEKPRSDTFPAKLTHIFVRIIFFDQKKEERKLNEWLQYFKTYGLVSIKPNVLRCTCCAWNEDDVFVLTDKGKRCIEQQCDPLTFAHI